MSAQLSRTPTPESKRGATPPGDAPFPHPDGQIRATFVRYVAREFGFESIRLFWM